MSNFKLKATHAPVKAYYETLERFGRGKARQRRKCAAGYPSSMLRFAERAISREFD
jgi:hypothetical protein